MSYTDLLRNFQFKTCRTSFYMVFMLQEASTVVYGSEYCAYAHIVKHDDGMKLYKFNLFFSL